MRREKEKESVRGKGGTRGIAVRKLNGDYLRGEDENGRILITFNRLRRRSVPIKRPCLDIYMILGYTNTIGISMYTV